MDHILCNICNYFDYLFYKFDKECGMVLAIAKIHCSLRVPLVLLAFFGDHNWNDLCVECSTSSPLSRHNYLTTLSKLKKSI